MSTMTLAPTAHTIRPQAARTQMRLTRRGRVVVFVATLLVVLAAAVLLGTSSVASNEPGRLDHPTRAVEVGAGDTLWDLAADVAGEGEVRQMVHTIKQINALDSSVLEIGQTVYVPIAD